MTPKEALPLAKAAAIKALELDSTLGEAHNSLAFCLDGFDWDFDSAGKEFQLAIELNPGYATAHHWYAWHLALLHQYDEAIVEMKKAETVDPLSIVINADLAELLAIAHRYEESIRQSHTTIEMDPNFGLAHNHLGQAYLLQHNVEGAIVELKEAVSLSARSPTCIANLARAFAAAGKRSDAEQLLTELKKRSSPLQSHVREHGAALAILRVGLERKLVQRRIAGVPKGELHEAAGIPNRQIAKHQPIDEAEDRGVGADRQRERGDRHRGEDRRPAERAYTVAEVLDGVLEPGQAALIAALLHRLRNAASLQPRLAQSLVDRKTAPLQSVSDHARGFGTDLLNVAEHIGDHPRLTNRRTRFRLALQQRFDRTNELFRCDRFEQECVGAHGKRIAPRLGSAVDGRHHYNRQRRGCAFHGFTYAEAIAVR